MTMNLHTVKMWDGTSRVVHHQPPKYMHTPPKSGEKSDILANIEEWSDVTEATVQASVALVIASWLSFSESRFARHYADFATTGTIAQHLRSMVETDLNAKLDSVDPCPSVSPIAMLALLRYVEGVDV